AQLDRPAPGRDAGGYARGTCARRGGADGSDGGAARAGPPGARRRPGAPGAADCSARAECRDHRHEARRCHVRRDRVEVRDLAAARPHDLAARDGPAADAAEGEEGGAAAVGGRGGLSEVAAPRPARRRGAGAARTSTVSIDHTNYAGNLAAALDYGAHGFSVVPREG